MDPGEGRILNFYMDRVLGGDIIVEQNIHVIDVPNWFLNGHPLKAHGAGGRTDWSGTNVRFRRRLRSVRGDILVSERGDLRLQLEPVDEFIF